MFYVWIHALVQTTDRSTVPCAEFIRLLYASNNRGMHSTDTVYFKIPNKDGRMIVSFYSQQRSCETKASKALFVYINLSGMVWTPRIWICSLWRWGLLGKQRNTETYQDPCLKPMDVGNSFTAKGWFKCWLLGWKRNKCVPCPCLIAQTESLTCPFQWKVWLPKMRLKRLCFKGLTKGNTYEIASCSSLWK